MLKKMPIRFRLTLMSVLLLTVCCIGLAVILNFSANGMVNTIEATLITPAIEAAPVMESVESETASDMVPITPLYEPQAAKNRFLYQSILCVILIVAAGGGITYYISGKALKPLQELSRQMKSRTAHNLSEELPIPESRDEIADLTDAFNQMTDKLEEAFAMQKRFSQSAAHELRTPLTVLKTQVEVFGKKTEHTPEEYDKLISVITVHTNRMSDLVKELLELTNMDALICNEKIQLKAMLNEIAEELTCLTTEKNITVAICGEERTICANQSLLHRAFYNLIENAIKYNSENGQVQILIAGTSAHSTVTISDTGIGIPAKMHQLIFEPFFRVDKSRSRQMGGAGLGLSTVKAIVEKHQGQITISDNPTGGTVFEVTL